MARRSTDKPRIEIPFFEGVNSTVQHVIAKKQELSHAENARSNTIGVLEKREGQAKTGTTSNGSPFYATDNYGLVKFNNEGANQDIFRVSTADAQDPGTLSVSVFELVSVGDYVDSNTPLQVKPVEYVTVSEPTFFSRLDGGVCIIDGTSGAASIYALNVSSVWSELSDADAQDIIGATTDSALVDSSLALVNGRDYNRLVSDDGTTVTSSTSAGSFFNSPRAHKVTFYKNRIYLGDYTREGIRYKTTIIRSSYPMGIVALVNGDHESHVSGTVLSLTDTKYFYADSGMNTYEVYRGTTLITTITVTVVNETSITVTHSGTPTINSADEIWVTGTFKGSKQYRWANKQTSVGQSAKQYDTFKLSGGSEDAITIMEPIGNVMLIANKNSMMVWNDYLLENMDLGIGCVSPRGYTKLMGSCYFVHYSGIYSTTGGVPVLVSRKIERYISGATKSGLENCAAGFKGLSVFFAIGDVTLYNKDDSFWKTLPNVCLEFDVADQSWFVHTNVSSSQFTNFIDSAGTERLLLSSNAGGKSIKEFLVGNTDDGDVIFFRADTQPLQFSRSFELYSEPTEIISEIDRGASMECFVALDDDDFYPVDGVFKKGISTLKVTSKDPQKTTPVSCRKIRVSFRDSSKQKCKLLQASVAYSPTSIEAPSGE
jgi:hypothetical protein